MALLLRAYLMPKSSLSEESCIFRLVMAFRSYRSPYHEIQAGYLPKDYEILHVERALQSAILSGRENLITFFLNRGAHNWRLAGMFAIRAQNDALALFFLNKFVEESGNNIAGQMWVGYLMYDLAKAGNMPMLEIFIAKNWINWNWGLWGAAAANNRQLIEFFIGKGANDFHEALHFAIHNGHVPLIEYFAEKGVIFSLNQKMKAAACGRQIALMNTYVSQGANNLNECMVHALYRRNQPVVSHLIHLGADADHGLRIAAGIGAETFVLYFLKQGATDVNGALLCAIEKRKVDMVAFLLTRGATNVVQALELSQKWKKIKKGRQIISMLKSLCDSTKTIHVTNNSQ